MSPNQSISAARAAAAGSRHATSVGRLNQARIASEIAVVDSLPPATRQRLMRLPLGFSAAKLGSEPLENEPATAYVTRVVGPVLERAQPDVPATELRVAVADNDFFPMALAEPSGLVTFTTAQLKRLQNEAQLKFVAATAIGGLALRTEARRKLSEGVFGTADLVTLSSMFWGPGKARHRAPVVAALFGAFGAANLLHNGKASTELEAYGLVRASEAGADPTAIFDVFIPSPEDTLEHEVLMAHFPKSLRVLESFQPTAVQRRDHLHRVADEFDLKCGEVGKENYEGLLRALD